jgi:hypothetical protein
VVEVAPRISASAVLNRITASITDWGRVVTSFPESCGFTSGDARVSVPGPAVADAAVTWMVSCDPES